MAQVRWVEAFQPSGRKILSTQVYVHALMPEAGTVGVDGMQPSRCR